MTKTTGPAKKAGKSMTIWIDDDLYFAMRDFCTAETRRTGVLMTHKLAMTEGLRLLLKGASKGKAA